MHIGITWWPPYSTTIKHASQITTLATMMAATDGKSANYIKKVKRRIDAAGKSPPSSAWVSRDQGGQERQRGCSGEGKLSNSSHASTAILAEVVHGRHSEGAPAN